MSIYKISGSILNLSFGLRGVTKIQESIYSIFLHHAILESGMNVCILNSNSILGLDELEDDMKTFCEKLVINKTEEATEEILARSNYERICIEAKKKNLPPLCKPICKPVNRPRKEFAYDTLEPKLVFELPCSTYDTA